MAWVEVLNEIDPGAPNTWRLCFQRVVYNYDNGDTQDGFRFIWRTEANKLQPARGQARIEDASTLFNLLEDAEREGWFIFPKRYRNK
jgi:hypothetical protein